MSAPSLFSLQVVAATVAVVGCASVPRAPATTAPTLPAAPASAATTSSAALPRTEPADEPTSLRWGLAYRRTCPGSITPPLLSADGTTIASCGALFTVDRGRFIGSTSFDLLALLPEGRRLVADLGVHGVSLVDPARSSPVHAAGGNVEASAVAPDFSRAVTLETSPTTGRRTIVVRALPSLSELRRTAIGGGPSSSSAVGFLADGREVALIDYACVDEPCKGPPETKARSRSTCTQPRCEQRGLFTFDRGTPTLLAAGLDHVALAAIGARGDTAAIVRDDGTASVIALPGGSTLASLAVPAARHGVSALALSSSGDRLAFAADDTIHVYGRSGGALVPLFSRKHGFTRSLTFSADGRTLFAGDSLAAYREGATERQPPAKSLSITPPAGFVRLEERDGEMILPGEPGGSSWLVPIGLVAMFHDRKHGATATVVALDPEELAMSGDATAWAHHVADRLLPNVRFDRLPRPTSGARLRGWGAPGARAVEMEYTADGCDPSEQVFRVQERDGALWLVHFETATGLSRARVAAWKTAFFDAPLGPAPARIEPEPRAKRRAKQR